MFCFLIFSLGKNIHYMNIICFSLIFVKYKSQLLFKKRAGISRKSLKLPMQPQRIHSNRIFLPEQAVRNRFFRKMTSLCIFSIPTSPSYILYWNFLFSIIIFYSRIYGTIKIEGSTIFSSFSSPPSFSCRDDPYILLI